MLDLKWSYIDFDRGIIFLPDSKTGQKPIILNAPALDVLATIPRAGSYVIPGNEPDQPRHDLKKFGLQFAVGPVLKGYAFTICDTHLPAWALAAAWDFRSWANCLVTHRRRPLPDTLN